MKTNEMKKLIKFTEHGDHRGSLISLEEGFDLPFHVKRVYYIYNTTPGFSRGFHAHKKLKQMLICVSGKCRLVVEDENERAEYFLDKPTEGLYIEGLKWREMHDLSENCILLVLADDIYNEEDYIRDYDIFRKLVST